jgi:nucleoside-diphosphate-sugar epimerase
MKGCIVLGASGRVGRAVLAHWPGPPPLRHARAGGPDLSWDMLADTAPELAALRGGVVIDLSGAVPGRGDVARGPALSLAAMAAVRAWGAAHLFAMSSSAVYGATATPATEGAATHPHAPYAAAKLTMERAFADASTTDGPRVTVLRLANVAGASSPWGAGEAPVLDRFTNGAGPSRSYVGPATLADVLARLTALALAHAPLPPVLNVAARRPTGMAAILAAMGRPAGWRTARPGAVPCVHLDTGLLERFCSVAEDAGDAAVLVAQARAAGMPD